MDKTQVLTKWNWTDTLILLFALIPICFALIRYADLPGELAVHFNSNWEPDGFQSKATFIVWFSLLTLALPILMKWMPRLDPKRDNYVKFNPFYHFFRLIIGIFLSAIYMMTILYNLGYDISMHLITYVLLGALWILLGNSMGQIRPNYMFGIRTPWTLANEEVWRKTHRASGPLWMLVGLLFIVTAFQDIIPMIYVIGLGIVISVIIPFIVSYWYFSKLKK
jgi:uncharacterized membrane protein